VQWPNCPVTTLWAKHRVGWIHGQGTDQFNLFRTIAPPSFTALKT
jgi:hypothetical protein